MGQDIWNKKFTKRDEDAAYYRQRLYNLRTLAIFYSIVFVFSLIVVCFSVWSFFVNPWNIDLIVLFVLGGILVTTAPVAFMNDTHLYKDRRRYDYD
jgi:hypothetical protein